MPFATSANVFRVSVIKTGQNLKGLLFLQKYLQNNANVNLLPENGWTNLSHE